MGNEQRMADFKHRRISAPLDAFESVCFFLLGFHRFWASGNCSLIALTNFGTGFIQAGVDHPQDPTVYRNSPGSDDHPLIAEPGFYFLG